MTQTETPVPVKGTVWLHASRKDWQGNPLKLTVTSFTDGKVYSRTDSYDKVKTPLALFEAKCLEIVSVPEPKTKSKAKTLTLADCVVLFNRADKAGQEAATNAVPVPMHVVERANPFDDSSAIVRDYGAYSEGVCGFAWVEVRPGNCAFAKFLKKNYRAHSGYNGGVHYWVSGYGQSMERKSAYAVAFAKVLSDAGINAYAASRMD